MSIIKSFSVGNGDMFYIKHGSDNFTIIDCCLSEDNKDDIINEIKKESSGKGITRFISTHPDEDHIAGLSDLNSNMELYNFYCVDNQATKDDESIDFKKYCEFRDSEKKAFYIYKGCSRKWMNQSDDERGSSGINILWPDTSNEEFKKALQEAKDGKSPNNISPIIKYSLQDGVIAMWMGDLETDFMEKIKDELVLENIDILFAPHHGRDSGKVPKELLDKLQPKVIIIGEADSSKLNYYNGYNTITQNSAGNIIFECESNKIHIYVGNSNYKATFDLEDEAKTTFENYIGTLSV